MSEWCCPQLKQKRCECLRIAGFSQSRTASINTLSKGCHLDVVRGPSTPYDPESDAMDLSRDRLIHDMKYQQYKLATAHST
jgi:hypothetical protein